MRICHHGASHLQREGGGVKFQKFESLKDGGGEGGGDPNKIVYIISFKSTKC